MTKSKIYVLIRLSQYNDEQDSVRGFTHSEEFAIEWVKAGRGKEARDYEEIKEELI